MEINNVEKYLTDKQVAARYNVHRTTVLRWVREGLFPKPTKLSEGCSRWSDAAIARHERKIEGR